MVIERFAKKGAGIAGSAVGGGIGGFLSSPFGLGALGLGAIVITLFLFRDRIGEFFGNLKLPELPSLPDITFPSLPDITFPSFEFPSLPDIQFPSFDFDFPDIEFPDIAGGAADFFGGLQSDFDQFIADSQANLDAAGGGAADFFGGGLDFLNNAIFGGGNGEPKDIDQFDFSGLEFGVSPEPTGEPAAPFRDAERFARDFPEVFSERDAFIQGGGALRDLFVESRLFTEQEFQGGGVSFIGGSVSETPISELSLSQIIDRFNVTASQAADIRARARDDFGDFDFGTSTGSGIGGVFEDPSLSTFLPSPNVSDPQFQGLSAREISRLITQGILSPQFLS